MTVNSPSEPEGRVVGTKWRRTGALRSEVNFGIVKNSFRQAKGNSAKGPRSIQAEGQWCSLMRKIVPFTINGLEKPGLKSQETPRKS